MEECLKQLLIIMKDKQDELDKKLINENDAKHRESILMFKDFLHKFGDNVEGALSLVVLFTLIEKCHED